MAAVLDAMGMHVSRERDRLRASCGMMMASLVVGPLVSLLKEKAYKVMEGMEEQHEILEHMLSAILNVIADAEKQASHREAVQAWLEKLKTVVYELHDVFDEFEYEALHRKAKDENHITKLRMAQVKFFPVHNRVAFRSRMGNKLRSIVETIEVLVAEMNSVGFKLQLEGEPARIEWREMDSIIMDLENTVSRSRDEEREKIVQILVNGQATNGDLMVIPVVGKGGVGKTTLAQLIYNDPRVQEHFQLKLWVCVSADGFNVCKLASTIMAQISLEGALEKLQEAGALKKLQEELRGKRYLLVLDDIWNEKNFLDKWENLKACLKHGGVGCAVLTTTRDKEIAQFMGTVVDSSQIKYCDLAILDMEFILDLYRSIPPDLRLCLAYLATLPDRRHMAKDDIILRWIALGLVEPYDGISTRYQRCEYIISTLLDVSFLGLANLATTGGKDDNGVVSFTMHGLVHLLARSIMSSTLVVLDSENQRSSFATKDCRYAVFTNFDVASSKLSGTTLPAKLRSLSLLGCSKLGLSSDSFSFPKYLRVLELREPSVQKLPDSICQLRLLGYLNLSGCSGLVQLPESFGNNLTNLLHINLSGCSALEKLPESFGNLECVVHISLSGCHGLDDLPKSFCKLNSLEHLDLSFCSCLREIPTALGGLTNLRYLNLSRPCCYAVEHKHHLEQLKDVWAKLTKLEYLNMSAFLNPIFCYLPEGEGLECFHSMFKGLSRLEHLDLSHNIFLVDLPVSTAPLSGLRTLDLSGCVRLKSIAKCIVGMNCPMNRIVLRNCPSLTYSFPVHSDDGAYSSNIVQLEDVSCKELEISCLEKVKSIDEAKRIRLDKKRKLEKLTLCWTGVSHGSSVDDEGFLDGLVPPQNLQRFELKGYRGKCLPAWLASAICSHLPNLVEVTMEDIPSCKTLPPLFLLPNLQNLALRKMPSIRKVDGGELSGGSRAVLHGLVRFTLDDLENLQEFNAIYRSGSEEFMFPIIDELVIQNCPNLKFGHFLPTAQRLQISPCEKVIRSLPKREAGGQRKGVEASSSSTSSASAPVTRVVVKNCKVPLGDWTLLHHLPGLRRLEIWNSNDLTGSPSLALALTSLQSLCFYQCNGTPSLLQSIDMLSNLKHLHIQGCPKLKRWCQSEENKEKLARIRIKYEDFATVEPDTAAHQHLTPAQSSLSVTLD